jgi:[CysO sulfur-carrier protein]-S-L-cysteine hydrolase
MLELSAEVADEMIAHSLRGLPDEACGLVAAAPGSTRVERFFPMTNAAASSQIYRLDGKEMLTVERKAEGDGLEIIGVMHSHTHTSAYPSPTDVRDAEMSDPFGAWHFVIVSLKHPEPAVRSFRILDGEVSEEAVRVV